MIVRNPPVGTECQDCGSPTSGHNLGCRTGHREANAEIKRLRAALQIIADHYEGERGEDNYQSKVAQAALAYEQNATEQK